MPARFPAPRARLRGQNAAAAAVLLLTRIVASEPGPALTERVLAALSAAGPTVEESAEASSQALNSLLTLVISEPGRRYGADAEAHDDAVRAKRAYLLSLSPAATRTSPPRARWPRARARRRTTAAAST